MGTAGALWLTPDQFGFLSVTELPSKYEISPWGQTRTFQINALSASVYFIEAHTCSTDHPDEVPWFNTEKMHISSSLHFLISVLLIWQYIFPHKKEYLQLFIHSCPLESSLPSVFLGFVSPSFIFSLVLLPLCTTEGLYYTLSHSQIMQGIVNML